VRSTVSDPGSFIFHMFVFSNATEMPLKFVDSGGYFLVVLCSGRE